VERHGFAWCRLIVFLWLWRCMTVAINDERKTQLAEEHWLIAFSFIFGVYMFSCDKQPFRVIFLNVRGELIPASPMCLFCSCVDAYR